MSQFKEIKQIIILYVNIGPGRDSIYKGTEVKNWLKMAKDHFLDSLSDEIKEKVEIVAIPSDRTHIEILTELEINKEIKQIEINVIRTQKE